MRLCPEYKLGGVTLHVSYSLGANLAVQPADVVSQQIDSANNSAIVTVRFPSSFGTTPFYLSATCENTHGIGKASNVLAVSNCDNLARFDNDQDGLSNLFEDTNCDNFFSPGDRSNPDNLDTDGDGVRDYNEVLSGTDPSNPGSSPRPYIFASAPFDYDGDGNSNPLVWRGSAGMFFVRDAGQSGNSLVLPWGQKGDIPITYQAADSSSNLGVLRMSNNQYRWLLRGPGVKRLDGSFVADFFFGLFGDNLVSGPWQRRGITNPAVARLYQNQWQFVILLDDGSVRFTSWGGDGDIPRVQDYDGDGIYDIAVFRPTQQKTYIVRSTDGQAEIHTFGTGTAEFTPRGDYTGDGIDDITFWEPITGQFTVMKSDNGFNDVQAANKNPNYYTEMQLGLYFIHLPLNWQKLNSHILFSVVDHTSGYRFYRLDNNPNNPPTAIQWGLPGDHQG